jgi:HEPN domain-containing protein
MAQLGSGDPSLAGLTAFHCQQAAEKALKAFLAWHDQTVPRTHDLPALPAQCRALEPGLTTLQQAASTLDDYQTAGRYPDVGPAPSAAEAEQALPLAEQVVASVSNYIPHCDPV